MEQDALVLYLHPRPETADLARQSLTWAGFSQVEWISSSVEAIACFESFHPDVVFIQAGLDDLPIAVVVKALRQLDDSATFWLVEEEVSLGLQAEAEAVGADGALTMPLKPHDLTRLLKRLRENAPAPAEEPTLASWLDDSSYGTFRQEIKGEVILHANELIKRGKYEHVGDLRILGDLIGMESLEVSGSVWVEGDIRESHVKCKGDLTVNGAIVDCRQVGVLCRSYMDVGDVRDSVLVCGRSLFLSRSALNSVINVGGRLVGKSSRSSLIGGAIRVCEHITASQIGDTSRTETRIELAAGLFYPSWVRAKAELWRELTEENAAIPPAMAQRFENQLRDRTFFRSQADLVAQVIRPATIIRVGDYEEFVARECGPGVRVYLNEGRDGKVGLRFDERCPSLTIRTHRKTS